MRFIYFCFAVGAVLGVASSCTSKHHDNETTASGLLYDNFRKEYNGKPTDLYTLTNTKGMEVAITNFGGRVVSLIVPDKDGNARDIVLGFENVESYYPENNLTDFGASIGRYANRINKGHLPVNGDTIQLPVNNFGHTLHGGPSGWQYQVYDVIGQSDSTLVLKMVSPDGDNGFPGEVTATVTYCLTNDNRLKIDYEAVTTDTTVINMTHHSYFNLNGDAKLSVTDHLLQVNASRYTPVDTTFMTTGEVLVVEGTPMDFMQMHAIGDNIADTTYSQILYAQGYDHNYILDNEGNLDSLAAVLYSPQSGIRMEVYTTEPGIQVYTGNFQDGTIIGKGGIAYDNHPSVCLETQHFPDSPNHPEWPTTLLVPGQTYRSSTVYSFSTDSPLK